MCATGVEGMDVQDLVALLANLGAQQQAILSAVAAKQRPDQKAAANMQPAVVAFQPGPSSLVPIGWGFDVHVTAGDSVAQAHLHCSGWKICVLAALLLLSVAGFCFQVPNSG